MAEAGDFVGGFHAVEARLRVGGVVSIDLDERRRDKRAQALKDLARARDVPVRRCPRAELDRRAPGIKHQGVLARIEPAAVGRVPSDWRTCIDGVDQPLILVLDGVEDPRNLGACLRSADGAGAHCVVVPERRSAPLSAVACKTAAGAAETLPVVGVTNLARELKAMKDHGLWIVGLSDKADGSLYASDLARPLVVVMGNEGQGLRRLTRDACDELLSLPMAGVVSSLNVSVATAVVLYEAVRQREFSVQPSARR